MEDAVSQKLFDERTGTLNKRVDKHSEEIDDLKAAVIKLTQIVENMEKKSYQGDIKTTKVTFWQTKSFEWMIKTGCAIIMLLTMAAIGLNYFKEYLEVMVK